MKPSYHAPLRRLLSVSAAIIVLAIAGYGHHSKWINPYPHLAFLRASGETVYIDSMDIRVATDNEYPAPPPQSSPNPAPPDNPTRMPPGSPTTQPQSSCFLISWSDNLKYYDERGMARREKYIQYEMRWDWVALAGGDTIHSTFFRQRPLLDRHLHQCALVFPVPAGHRIDTLMYTGTEAVWGKRLFILKRK